MRISILTITAQDVGTHALWIGNGAGNVACSSAGHLKDTYAYARRAGLHKAAGNRNGPHIIAQEPCPDGQRNEVICLVKAGRRLCKVGAG